MKPKKILVVEDDPILRDLVRRQVIKLGFECESVDSGEEALRQDYSQIGLVFMDIGLPGIDGTYATLLLREQELVEQRKRVPIVALTGHSDRKTTFAVGMDDFLQKPALINDIKRMLEKWMPVVERS